MNADLSAAYGPIALPEPATQLPRKRPPATATRQV